MTEEQRREEAEAYEKHKGLVMHYCYAHASKERRRHDNKSAHGEDYTGVAHTAFVQSLRSFLPGKGEFSKFLMMCVDRSLRHHRKKEDRQPKAWGMGAKAPKRNYGLNRTNFDLHFDVEMNATDRVHFDLDRLLNEVSEQGKELILAAVAMLGTGGHKRGRLKKAMKGRGWSDETIEEVFTEVWEALGT